VLVVWNYNGLSAQQMADRITAMPSGHDHHGQRHRNIESQSLGHGIIKIFFQPDVNIASRVRGECHQPGAVASLPPGTVPRSSFNTRVERSGAANRLSGKGLDEQRLTIWPTPRSACSWPRWRRAVAVATGQAAQIQVTWI